MPLPLPTEKFLTLSNGTVCYIDQGMGPPLVLVHGILACLEFWVYLLPELSKYFRVIAVDLPGFGKTDDQTQEYTLEYYAQFLENFLAALHIERSYLAAHSLGGALALSFALDYPHRIQKLMLINSTGFHRQVSWLFRLLKIKFFGYRLTHLKRPLYEQALRSHVYDSTTIQTEFVDHAHPLIQNDKVSQTTLAIIHRYAGFRGIHTSILKSLWQRFDRLKNLPILIVWGRNDRILNIRHTKAAQKLLPHAKIEILERCGHLPLIEHPEKVVALMREFFQETG